jgi:hypothetical protein
MLTRLADEKTRADSGKMKLGGCDHEAGSIGDPAAIRRNFQWVSFIVTK